MATEYQTGQHIPKRKTSHIPLRLSSPFAIKVLPYPTIFYPLDSRLLRFSSTFEMQIVLYSLNLIFGWGCPHSFSPSKCRLYPHPHILPHKSCSILLFLTQTNCIICFFLAIKVILLHDATLLPNLFLHRLNTRWMRTTTQAGRTSWWLMINDSILLVKEKIKKIINDIILITIWAGRTVARSNGQTTTFPTGGKNFLNYFW